MAGWTNPYNLLTEEFIQRTDEGCVIPDALRQAQKALHWQKDAWNTAAIDPIYDALMALEPDAALAKREPNELSEIRALRPEGPRDLRWKPSDAEALDRFHGAWTGRAVGCALGKPVEGMGMSRDKDGRLNGRRNIKTYLSSRNDWPLKDYFSGRETSDGLKIHCQLSQRETIAFMEADDDIHYSLTGLGVIEQKGPEFAWDDVARYWLSHIPPSAICTAETQAITNVQNRSCRGHDMATTPAWTRRHRNPYREWIGAQIRSDGWAWVCAGKPELAAEFAWRDACWTHERNGIYGEMMFAAMQAAAFVEHDPRKLVEIGLSEIPKDCRLAQWTRECLKWVAQEKTFEACMDRVEAALPDMHVVHTINNALVCVLSLFYGGSDADTATSVAVMCGLDTDCNGATVGSIVGAGVGRKRFGGTMAAKLNDTIKPNMLDFQQVTMAELAARTLTQWKRVDEYHRARQGGGAKAAAKAG